MDNNKLIGILYQIQEQNKELRTMVMNLQVSNNQLKTQLNQDFHKVYTAVYEPKPSVEDVPELLKSKKLINDEMDFINDRTTEKIIAKFEEDFLAMEENLDNIIN